MLYRIHCDEKNEWLPWNAVKPRLHEMGFFADIVHRSDGTETLVGPGPARLKHLSDEEFDFVLNFNGPVEAALDAMKNNPKA